MSDTQNALSTAAHGGSVLDAIAHPQVVNPLAAYAGAIGTARSVYDLRQQQANEAAGQAYQGAINPQTGEFDPNELRRRLAASGPAAMAAGATLLNTQQISSNQLEQNLAKLKWWNSAAANLAENPSHDNAIDLVRQGVAGGALTFPEAQRIMSTVPTDPAALQAFGRQHMIMSSDALTQFNQIYGQRMAVPAGGHTEIPTVPPPGKDGTPIITHSASPGEQGELITVPVPYDESGNVVTDPQKNPVHHWGNITVPRSSIGGLPMPPGGGGGTSPPGVPQPGTVGSPGRINPVPPQGSPLRNPNAAPPTTPPGVQVTPSGTPVIQAPPQGQPQQIEQDQQLYRDHVAAMPDQQARLVAGQTALEALRLARTGPGTETSARMYAFLQAQGLDPGVNPNDFTSTAARQILQKNLLRFAQNTAARSTNTDLGLETQLHSNANAEEMLSAANEHVLIQDLGLLRQRIGMTKLQDPNGIGYRERVKNFPSNTDPVAFAWDFMSPSARQAYLDRLGGQDTPAYKKWAQSMKLARDAGMITVPAQ
jgi:hypothetical protein